MPETFIIDKDDFKSEETGYHFNVWNNLAESLGLSEDIERIEIKLVRVIS